MTLAAWVALSLTGKIGARTLSALLAYFDEDIHAILRASESDLQQVHGVGPAIAAAITSIDLARVERDLRRWESHDVRVITRLDPSYPSRLNRLPDAPLTLFVLGSSAVLDHVAVAIVGTRTPSPWARDYALLLSAMVASTGRVVVSGLAVGIDAQAHAGALDMADGQTVAVLGSGVLSIYPPIHHSLAAQILQRGALVSEVNPDSGPSASTLVARNRIITGLADTVCIIETSPQGGAMHAARFAVAQERPLYAVDCEAAGNRQLITAGAQPLSRPLTSLPF